MSGSRTYLDFNASAPLRPEARTAVIAALDVNGNAASAHAEGRRARGLIDEARDRVAALVGAKPEEVVFTSGATEANNWAVRGGWRQVVVGATEHDSILAPARALNRDVIELPCDATGIIAVDGISRAVGLGERGLVTVQLANAETGVLQPLGIVASRARSAGFLVHSDAVQAAGRVPVDFHALGLDLMSISSHKIGGPKGVGALVIRNGLDIAPLLAGGGQERRRRSGTENVAAIAGFGAAAEAARRDLDQMPSLTRLRDDLEARLLEITPTAVVVGCASPRLPNTSCIALPGAQAATLLIRLDLAGIAVSAGSACSSGRIGGSHVLAAMGIDKRLAAGAIRVSLGHGTTAADIDSFIAVWRDIHAPGVSPSGAAPSHAPHHLSINTRRAMVADPQGPLSAQPPGE